MTVTWAYNVGTNTATASGAGSTNFAALVAADTAGGWGKFTADATGTQILCSAKIQIGNSAQVVNFIDSGKQITFVTGAIPASDYPWIYVYYYSTITLGILQDATAKTTSDGCSLIATDTTYWGRIIQTENQVSVESIANLYSCTFLGFRSGYNYLVLSSLSKMYNCMLTGGFDFADATGDLFNLYISNTQYAFFHINNDADFTGVHLLKCNTLAFLVGSNNAILRDIVALQNTLVIECVSFTGNLYLINPKIDTWAYSWYLSTGGKVFRQYEFDLTTDTSALCVLKDVSNNTVFSVTSDGTTGAIATQTVSRGFYDQAHGDTLQDYGSFALTISKAGKNTHTETIILTQKTQLQITLENPSTTISSGRHHLSAQEQKDLDLLEPSLMLNALLLIQKQKNKEKQIS